MNMKTAMVLTAVSVLVCGCAETTNQAGFGVSAQDPYYMIDGSHDDASTLRSVAGKSE
jgi:hypothetical protein